MGRVNSCVDQRLFLHFVFKVGRGSCLVCCIRLEPHQDYPTIIFAHGFPGHEKNAALAQLLRKAGFHVLIFYYGGSWGSEGVFSFAGSIRDTLAVIDYLMADTNYHIDRRHIFLLGHSYGAPVIARAMEQRPSIFGSFFNAL